MQRSLKRLIWAGLYQDVDASQQEIAIFPLYMSVYLNGDCKVFTVLIEETHL